MISLVVGIILSAGEVAAASATGSRISSSAAQTSRCAYGDFDLWIFQRNIAICRMCPSSCCPGKRRAEKVLSRLATTALPLALIFTGIELELGGGDRSVSSKLSKIETAFFAAIGRRG